MKKAAKRTKSNPSSKRAGVKAKTAKTTKAKMSTKSKKTLIPKVGSKLERVAKKAAVAAGAAAVSTALSELKPEQKVSEGDAETKPKPGNTSTR
jgi:hypothetical protein